MIRSCEIATDKRIAQSLCNSRASIIEATLSPV